MQPLIIHQVEALKNAGCDEVVLAINYQPKVRRPARCAHQVLLTDPDVCIVGRKRSPALRMRVPRRCTTQRLLRIQLLPARR